MKPKVATLIIITIIIVVSLSLVAFAIAIHKSNPLIPLTNITMSGNVTLTRDDSWNVGIQTINGQDIEIHLVNGTNILVLSECQFFNTGDSILIQSLTYQDSSLNHIMVLQLTTNGIVIPVSESCGYMTKI